MFFGPPGILPAPQPPTSESALAETVRTTAHRLLDDLQRVSHFTASQHDRALGDALVEVALSFCLARLAATGVWGEANRTASSILWHIAGPCLELGWLQHRARFKPRGYAGDEELLTRICRGEECNSDLGRLFDRYFLRQAAPQAVRARTEQTASALAAHCLSRPAGPYHVVSVGSGPALDLAGAAAILPDAYRNSLRVTLLDLDPEALDSARRTLQQFIPPQAISVCRENLFRLGKKPDTASLFRDADFLICSGLFDYLDDASAQRLLEVFWNCLAGGGQMLVGNFAPHNPTRAYMEWIGNWYLTYRTAEHLDALAASAGIPSCKRVISADRTGIDLFVEAAR